MRVRTGRAALETGAHELIDQGLKERLTGAVVLMVAAVIFVPWLLDGPEQTDEPMEQRSLALPVAPVRTESREQPADERPAATSPQRKAGQPANEEPRPPEPRPADQKAAAQAVSAVPADPLSAWAVQVGSFTSKENADRLSETLKEGGYRAFVTRATDQGKTFYRVRVGPEQQRARAEALAQRLQKDGQKTAVLRHP